MSKIHQRTLLGLVILFVCITLGYGQNGIVVTERSSPPGVVSFSASSTLTGVSNTKHVDGYVKKYGATHFTFPVGDNGTYRPFAAEADETVGAYFKTDPGAATLPSGAPFSTSSKETGIKNVSNKEYWDVDGANSSKLSFTWDAASDISALTEQSLENLSLVGWNNLTSKWEIITSTIDEVALLGGSSSLSSGSISTVEKIVPNQYRAYTFASLNVANVPASYEGEFETAGCSEITGWAWDKNHPEAALTLELIVEGTVHATFVADNFRSDLASAGKGTGKYGFRVQVPSNLMNGVGQELSVRVRSSNFILTGSPKTINCSYDGTFEVADCGTISGWMQDKNNPNAALEFEVVEGTTVHGSGIANIYRPDLQNAGIGTGKYGFNIALPLSLKDGKNHQLRIRIKGKSYLITGSKSITCSASQFDGYAYADCQKLYGWAWDRKYPETAMTIEIYEGTKIYATVVANTFRQDLQDGGIGTANYGYSISLPAALKDGKTHELNARIKGTSFVLKNSPRTLTCAVPASLTGTLESADCSTIKGYAWDESYPEKAVVVELMEGTKVWATDTADIYRSDLVQAGIGTGKYGFSFALPSALRDANAHALSVRIKGTSVILSGSPKNVTCALPASYGGGFDFLSCATIKGWAWNKNYPDQALTVEIMEGSTVITTVLANKYREDIKTKGFGTGIYGFEISLPASLKDGASHVLSVRVKGTTYIVPGSPKTVTCAVPTAYAGTLESADCNFIKGFAWDKNYPAKAVTVEVMEGSTVLATAVADTYRADLKTAGMGTGNYGFSIPAPAILKDGATHAVSVRIQGTSTILTGSPISVNCALPASYGGGFDFLSCATIKGWAWNKNYPDQALTVEIMEGSTVITTVLANKYREDIKTRGFGTGIYGFEISLPASLKDGASHVLSVRVKGTTYIVPGSPKTVTCAVPTAYAGTLESADCNFIKGFAWDKNYPAKAVTVEVMEGSTILATVVANTYREDLKTAGTGTGNYGFSIPAPAILKDGATHAVSVRIQGTSTILTGSPISVNCALPASYGGGFDFLSCATIKGWAWNKNYPDQALTVEIMEGSTVITTVLANKYREDIKTRGFGTGIYGFEISLPASLKDGAAHILSVRVKGTTYIVPGSPKTVTCAVPTAYAGTLESADCNFIKGFAWDKNYPAKTVTVEVMEGSTVLATVVADTYRADLKTAGMGTGNYGFSIPAPAILKDGATHAVSVRIQGTSTILTGSPISVNCALPASYGGGFDFLSCATIKGWAWNKNYPDQALTVEIMEGSTVITTVLANKYREDIKTKGFGTGIYGFEISLPASLKDGAAHILSVRVKGTTYIVPGSPKTVTCAVPTAYAGTLESADCNFIKGFAWDKNYPAKTVTVEVMEGSTVLATVVADTYRADLKTAGMGTGNYGFSIPAPAILKDGATHAVSVRIQGTSTILTGSPISVNCALPASYNGGFDFLSCATIKGWAWNKNYPDQTLTLEIIEGTTVYGTVTASLYREDIKNKGYGTGNYGFNLSTPAAMKDGTTHSISLRVKGTTYIIPGSPRAVTCASPARTAILEDLEVLPEEETEGVEVVLAPNPTAGKMVAHFYLAKDVQANLSVVNLVGRTVWQRADIGAGAKMQESIDLSQQEDGIYIFKFKVGSSIQTKRIVLTK